MSQTARLVLVRGHQGSGKSTLADALRERAGFQRRENDDFFVVDGVYSYDPERHAEAKAWCLERVAEDLASGCDVVVSNTFTSLSEIGPYLDLGHPTTVVEMHLDFPNGHGVPGHVVEAKKAAFETFEGAVAVRDVEAAAAFPNLFDPLGRRPRP